MAHLLPGPLCRILGALDIDAGTLCKAASPKPGPVKIGFKLSSKHYSEHFGIVSDPLSKVGTAVILNNNGSPQCATLIKKLANAPSTGENNWKKGLGLNEINVSTINIGTPIATGWNSNGFYPHNSTGQHSGIFAGVVKDKTEKVIGFLIVEQYSGLETIISRSVYFDPISMKKKNTYFYRGKDYATIQW